MFSYCLHFYSYSTTFCCCHYIIDKYYLLFVQWNAYNWTTLTGYATSSISLSSFNDSSFCYFFNLYTLYTLCIYSLDLLYYQDNLFLKYIFHEITVTRWVTSTVLFNVNFTIYWYTLLFFLLLVYMYIVGIFCWFFFVSIKFILLINVDNLGTAWLNSC